MKYISEHEIQGPKVTFCVRIQKEDKDWLSKMGNGSVPKGIRKLIDLNRAAVLKEWKELEKKSA